MTPSPILISYDVFIANAEEDDIHGLALLANGEIIRTPDEAEAATYEARGMRLRNAGLLTRFRRSHEDDGGQVWHVFDAVVHPVAITYVARAAKERVIISRDPLPNA